MRTLIVASLVFAACSTPVGIRFGTHRVAAPVVAISNPEFADGDAEAGRRLFVDLGCVDCHRVAGDPTLTAGRRSIAGPLLAGLSAMPPNAVANRITSRSTGANEELFGRTMKDYAQPMTARQLVDVVAYLRTPRNEERR
jgi:hypothetical protein